MRWLKNIGIFLLVVYVILCLGLYFAQERIILRPKVLPQNFQFRTGEELKLKVEEGIELSCLWMRATKARGVILYLHGNRGSISRCIYQAQNMAGNNYDIFIPDYRGFGKSDGKFESEKQVYQDVQKVYDYLKTQYKEEQIVIVGYSLGSGMASYLAAQNTPQKLVLLAPYYSFVDLKNRILPFIPNFILKYHFRSDLFMNKIECPVHLFHGTSDRVIPFNSSEKLQEINPGNIKLSTLKGESHRGTIFNPIFRQTFPSLLD